MRTQVTRRHGRCGEGLFGRCGEQENDEEDQWDDEQMGENQNEDKDKELYDDFEEQVASIGFDGDEIRAVLLELLLEWLLVVELHYRGCCCSSSGLAHYQHSISCPLHS